MYHTFPYFAPYWASPFKNFFEQIGIPIPQAYFPPRLVEIGS